MTTDVTTSTAAAAAASPRNRRTIGRRSAHARPGVDGRVNGTQSSGTDRYNAGPCQRACPGTRAGPARPGPARRRGATRGRKRLVAGKHWHGLGRDSLLDCRIDSTVIWKYSLLMLKSGNEKTSDSSGHFHTNPLPSITMSNRRILHLRCQNIV